MSMQNMSVLAVSDSFELNSTPDFRVLLAYQDFAAGLRAKEFFDRLVQDHGGVFRFICHLWKFDLLQAPGLEDQAVAEAAKADMIVIAAHDHSTLPPTVKAWFERWLRRNRIPGALVALVDASDPRHGTSSEMCASLREFAERGRMKFFCKGQAPAPTGFPFARQNNEQSPRTAPLALEGGFSRLPAQSHWGINE